MREAYGIPNADRPSGLRLLEFASLYFASLIRPTITQGRKFCEERVFGGGWNHHGQHERKQRFC
jgi:hypothetical protein